MIVYPAEEPLLSWASSACTSCEFGSSMKAISDSPPTTAVTAASESLAKLTAMAGVVPTQSNWAATGNSRSIPNSLAVGTKVAFGQPPVGLAKVIGTATAFVGLSTRFVVPLGSRRGSVTSIEHGSGASSQKKDP